MPNRSRPSSGMLRAVALVAASASLAAACASDQGVVSLSATPAPTAPPAPELQQPTDDPATPDEDPATPDETETDASTAPVESTEPPAPTLPPIIEPELAVSIPFSDVIDVDDNRPAREHDEFVAVAFTDIERWWAEAFPSAYGEPFAPLEGGVFAGYPDRESDIPGCGTPRATAYDELQLYVAFYCELGDFMAYDDGGGLQSILVPLAEEFGPAVLGVVLAHEYGHAIQARVGALDRTLPTIFTEQQADCFAGAWTGQAYRGESPLLRLGDRDVRSGLIAIMTVRDPVGTDQFVPGGHGSAFDRIGAFQEGFVNGPARCAELLDVPLDLMPNEFRTTTDAFFEGNAPYDCSELDPSVVGQDFIDACTPAPEFLAEDINHFWQTSLGDAFREVDVVAVDDVDAFTCVDKTQLTTQAAVCAAEDLLVYDEPAVLDLYREFGDFTLGYFYGIGWAELVQVQIASTLAGEERALANDCFTGAWVRDITPDRFGDTPRMGDRDGDGLADTVTSSPGDLDEAIRMAIIVGDEGANVDVVGSPFEKIEAFRAGVLGGLDACQAMLVG